MPSVLNIFRPLFGVLKPFGPFKFQVLSVLKLQQSAFASIDQSTSSSGRVLHHEGFCIQVKNLIKVSSIVIRFILFLVQSCDIFWGWATLSD